MTPVDARTGKWPRRSLGLALYSGSAALVRKILDEVATVSGTLERTTPADGKMAVDRDPFAPVLPGRGGAAGGYMHMA